MFIKSKWILIKFHLGQRKFCFPDFLKVLIGAGWVNSDLFSLSQTPRAYKPLTPPHHHPTPPHPINPIPYPSPLTPDNSHLIIHPSSLTHHNSPLNSDKSSLTPHSSLET